MTSGAGNLFVETEPVAEEIEDTLPSGRVSRGMLRDGWARLRKMPAPFTCFWLIVALLVVALLSALGVPLTPYSFDQTSKIPAMLSAAPSWAHPMGTDELGRDLLTRIIYGARLSISI